MISERIAEETRGGTVNRLERQKGNAENGRRRAGCGSSLSEGSARGPSKVILARSRRVAF